MAVSFQCLNHGTDVTHLWPRGRDTGLCPLLLALALALALSLPLYFFSFSRAFLHKLDACVTFEQDVVGSDCMNRVGTEQAFMSNKSRTGLYASVRAHTRRSCRREPAEIEI